LDAATHPEEVHVGTTDGQRLTRLTNHKDDQLMTTYGIESIGISGGRSTRGSCGHPGKEK
jgi:hypothetical protein